MYSSPRSHGKSLKGKKKIKIRVAAHCSLSENCNLLEVWFTALQSNGTPQVMINAHPSVCLSLCDQININGVLGK